MRGISKIVVALVTVLILAAALFGVYLWFSTNSTVKIEGVCSAVTYLVPDTTTVTVTNVTETTGNSTTIFESTSTLPPSTEIIGSTIYTTTTSARGSSTYAVTNTTNYPFGEWVVLVCTFSP